MRAHAFGLALLAGAAISGQSLAVEPSGTTVDVNPQAEAGGVNGLRVIEVKGPIYMGDLIITGPAGQVQILFVDDTKFVVGPNSKATIDAFVFDADKTAQDVSISAVKGAFRFITGNSPKQNYAIRTPTMTIGVRGTALDLAVRTGTGESMVVTHEGLTDICDALDRCLEGIPGSMIVGTAGGLESVPPGFDRTQRLLAFFPLMRVEARLNQAFVIPIPTALFFREPDPEIHSVTGDPPEPNEHSVGTQPDHQGSGHAPDGRPPRS
jgi:hypothetical protein